MGKIILGSGLSGLSAAYYFTKKYPLEPIRIFEATNRVGGWVKSTIQNDGTIFEQGPRTIRPKGAQGINTLELVEELGLTNKIRPILSSHPAATNRMIFANNKLHMLPSSFWNLFKMQKPFTRPLIWYLVSEYFAEQKTVSDESIYDFTFRRFGEEIADYLISPMICGICAGNAKEVSVKFLMNSLFEKEQKYGSIGKGLLKDLKTGYKGSVQETALVKRARVEKWSVYSFDGGMEILPRAILAKVENYVKLQKECTKIEFTEGGVSCHFNDGTIEKGDHLISSIPAEKLCDLVEIQHPNLASNLRKIQPVSVGVVNLKYDGKLIKQDGFGFLVAPKENLPLLGVIYDSCCFPNTNNTILTAMMGGYWFKEQFGENPSEDIFIENSKEQLRKILQIKTKPVDYKVNILKNCIPQYQIGHQENWAKINEYIQQHKLPISLCGASYEGVGVNDVILSAKNVVDNL